MRSLAFAVVFAVAVNVGIVLVNGRAARKLEAELASLPPESDT
jgi:hypothetical protein